MPGVPLPPPSALYAISKKKLHWVVRKCRILQIDAGPHGQSTFLCRWRSGECNVPCGADGSLRQLLRSSQAFGRYPLQEIRCTLGNNGLDQGKGALRLET